MMLRNLASLGFVSWVANFSSGATNQNVLSPADELKSFRVPPGFIVELAASEPDLPKPITVTWDGHVLRAGAADGSTVVDRDDGPERVRVEDGDARLEVRVDDGRLRVELDED